MRMRVNRLARRDVGITLGTNTTDVRGIGSKTTTVAAVPESTPSYGVMSCERSSRVRSSFPFSREPDYSYCGVCGEDMRARVASHWPIPRSQNKCCPVSFDCFLAVLKQLEQMLSFHVARFGSVFLGLIWKHGLKGLPEYERVDSPTSEYPRAPLSHGHPRQWHMVRIYGCSTASFRMLDIHLDCCWWAYKIGSRSRSHELGILPPV